jgi:tRNA threonylcarbamoyladenosine biosynthesis protein TsaE
VSAAGAESERTLETGSAAETEALGRRLGQTAPAGGLVGLVGELGAGKTCLVRGLAAGLGADADAVHSPSFVIVTEYEGGRLPLAHVDLYRLEAGQVDELSFRDVLFGGGVAAVEWFDRLGEVTSGEALIVELRYAPHGRRRVRLVARGARHARWLAAALDERGD